jgi:hypothetical protein
VDEEARARFFGQGLLWTVDFAQEALAVVRENEQWDPS